VCERRWNGVAFDFTLLLFSKLRNGVKALPKLPVKGLIRLNANKIFASTVQ